MSLPVPLRVAVLLISLAALRSRAGEWRDPSKHLVRFIEVEPGVKLEVLDWGGAGEPIILLAGHGDTAHVFDDFAPELTSGNRVLAITRRGLGASTHPLQSYHLDRLVDDIAQVANALNLKRVHLAGHSIAGDEMTRFALTYPGKLGKLIYLDAAYDRLAAQHLEAAFPKLPPAPGTARESGSPGAVRALVAQTEILMPESEIRATRVFGPDGLFVRPGTSDDILRSVASMVEHPRYGSIDAPVLAIYAVYRTPSQFFPRYKIADLQTRHTLDQIFGMWRPFAKAQRDLLREQLPGARVVEIQGASHYVFISHREKVLFEIRAFLAAT